MTKDDLKREGFIFAYRRMKHHWTWQDKPFSKGQAWLDLLLSASYQPNKVLIDGQLFKLQRGEQCRSQLTLAREWGWSRVKVKNFLEKLEKDEMIIYKTNQRTTLISICNYDDFQNLSTTHNTTEKQPSDNGQDTNNKANNINKAKLAFSTNYPELELLALYIKQKLESKNLLIRKDPDIEKWIDDLLRLQEVNNVNDWETIKTVFDWAHNHTQFWQDRIKSPNSLCNSWGMLLKQKREQERRA